MKEINDLPLVPNVEVELFKDNIELGTLRVGRCDPGMLCADGEFFPSDGFDSFVASHAPNQRVVERERVEIWGGNNGRIAGENVFAFYISILRHFDENDATELFWANNLGMECQQFKRIFAAVWNDYYRDVE